MKFSARRLHTYFFLAEISVEISIQCVVFVVVLYDICIICISKMAVDDEPQQSKVVVKLVLLLTQEVVLIFIK